MSEAKPYSDRSARSIDGQAEAAALKIWLAAHVRKLAEEIGERNVLHPEVLHAAADYIRGEWMALGAATSN